MTSSSASSISNRSLDRREFLYYLLGASAGMLSIQACAASLWFAFPRDKEQTRAIDFSDIPSVDEPPIGVPERRLWLSTVDTGLLAFVMACGWDGRLFVWVTANLHFECPMCGSKWDTHGTHLDGPALWDLPRYPVRILTGYEERITPSTGEPVNLADALEVYIDTRYQLRPSYPDKRGILRFNKT
jgi:cytochrome b6-f complex iron-sulfur subunit